MRKYTGPDGIRLWIESVELEDLIHRELVGADLLPDLDRPVVDVEGFVERHLLVQFDPYADLAPAVLGETEFRVGNPVKISINKDLTRAAMDDDESPLGIRGRWRATVAHEATHVLLHRCLFDLCPEQATLFPVEDETASKAGRLQRCLKRDVIFGGRGGDWREIQANMGMGALLMPRALFTAAFEQEADRRGLRRIDRGSVHVAPLASALARRFEVSRQAASIRLETLSLLAQPGQSLLTD